MHEWLVGPDDAGSKLIAFLAHKFDFRFSAKFLKRAVENNRCQINGRTERFASFIVNAGDHISLILENFSVHHQPVVFEPDRILFEDNFVLVYNKPMGINCDDQGILNTIRHYRSSVRLIHRLDRNTTGVLLLAKDMGSYVDLIDQFKKTLVSKCYRTIVDGCLQNKGGIINNYLGKKKAYEGQTIWGKVSSGGLYAYTEWKRLKVGKDATLLHCFPKTGRTHQLRVHMAEMGHPIIGDYQYSKHFQCSFHALRYLLHAERLIFNHPHSGKSISIEAPLPEDFIIAQGCLFGKSL